MVPKMKKNTVIVHYFNCEGKVKETFCSGILWLKYKGKKIMGPVKRHHPKSILEMSRSKHVLVIYVRMKLCFQNLLTVNHQWFYMKHGLNEMSCFSLWAKLAKLHGGYRFHESVMGFLTAITLIVKETIGWCNSLPAILRFPPVYPESNWKSSYYIVWGSTSNSKI